VHELNRGVGAAIRTGIDAAKAQNHYDYLIIMASNGKMLPEEISTLVEPLHANKADYVQGSRFLVGNRSPGLTVFRRLSIPIFTCLMNLILSRRFTDVTCGFRAYRMSILFDPNINIYQSWLDQYEFEYYIHYWVCCLGYRVQEVPVTMKYTHLAAGRKSKIKPFVGWWSMFRPFLLLTLRIKR
jgi:dolichol-phosphate mannosyltransferase